MKAVFLLLLSCLILTAGEEITSFHSDVTIQDDGSLLVVETIDVIATGDRIQRGIYRDFPLITRSAWGIAQRKPFAVTSITRGGEPEPFTRKDQGSGARIFMGQEDQLLKEGSHRYQIHYKTSGHLIREHAYDQLYWNVTGNYWTFPIREASATIRLPASISATEAAAFTGLLDSTETDAEVVLTGSTVNVTTTRQLARGEGLTVAVNWPANQLGSTEDSGALLGSMDPRFRNGLFTVFCGLLAHVVAWYWVGRDKRSNTIIPRYTPPSGLSPAAVRTIHRMGFDDLCFAANVIGLASKNCFKLKKTSDYYILKKSQKANENLSSDEAKLLRNLNRTGLPLALSQTNYGVIEKAKADLTASIQKKTSEHFRTNAAWLIPGIVFIAFGLLVLFTHIVAGQLTGLIAAVAGILSYFAFTPKSTVAKSWRRPLSASLMVCAAGLIWFTRTGANTAVIMVFLTSAWITISFFRWIKAPTASGRSLMDEIDGFKHYLSVAEEERLNAEVPPEKTPEIFERFLPYAFALGVEQQWCEKFESTLAGAAARDPDRTTYSPGFYDGHDLSSPTHLAAIGGALSGALASAAIDPSTAGSLSGGGGGSFDSGSSGGGSGGGGGGGW